MIEMRAAALASVTAAFGCGAATEPLNEGGESTSGEVVDVTPVAGGFELGMPVPPTSGTPVGPQVAHVVEEYRVDGAGRLVLCVDSSRLDFRQVGGGVFSVTADEFRSAGVVPKVFAQLGNGRVFVGGVDPKGRGGAAALIRYGPEFNDVMTVTGVHLGSDVACFSSIDVVPESDRVAVLDLCGERILTVDSATGEVWTVATSKQAPGMMRGTTIEVTRVGTGGDASSSVLALEIHSASNAARASLPLVVPGAIVRIVDTNGDGRFGYIAKGG